MKAKMFCLCITTLLLLLAVSVIPAWALTVPLKFEDIVRKAEVIFSGTVTGIEHKVLDVGGKRIPYTFVTFSVTDKIKGASLGDTHTIKLIGGPLPEKNLTYHVSDVPVFKTGEEVFLFLGPGRNDYSPVVGMDQGLFRITLDSQGGKVIKNADGVSVKESFVTGNDRSDNGISYEVFKSFVSSKVQK
jgi:hypothetical protein